MMSNSALVINSMSPADRLSIVQRILEQHINECPSGVERNALTNANIILRETKSGRRQG